MRAHHDGFFDSLAMDVARAGRVVGDHGLAHQVGTHSRFENDLQFRGIL